MRHRAHLPQLDGSLFLTDAGLETELVFHDGIDLPLFAAFPLLADDTGTDRLRRYYLRFAELARERATGLVLETPTWRASRRWATELGLSPAELERLNRKAVELLEAVRAEYETDATPIVVSGQLGPQDDGYDPGEKLSALQAEAYHAEQIATFADAGVDLISVLTMTYADEAIGVARAARAAGMPSVISFTVETDGMLPSGQALGEAITEVDAATDRAPAYYMINCAHPTHFEGVLEGDWVERVRGLRANASTCSHAELDEATELDDGDPDDLAQRYTAMRAKLPALNVLGGCCGTDIRHVERIAGAWIEVTSRSGSDRVRT